MSGTVGPAARAQDLVYALAGLTRASEDRAAGVAVRRSGMTQQYIAGELSVLLARLQAVATDEGAVGEVGRLRREAETRPLCTLPRVEARALELADGLCWACLARGDPATFDRVATIGAQLREFGVCSGLLPNG